MYRLWLAQKASGNDDHKGPNSSWCSGRVDYRIKGLATRSVPAECAVPTFLLHPFSSPNNPTASLVSKPLTPLHTKREFLRLAGDIGIGCRLRGA